jgi:hypothetical protein
MLLKYFLLYKFIHLNTKYEFLIDYKNNPLSNIKSYLNVNAS